MLDVKRLRREPQEVAAALAKRGANPGLDGVFALDEEWRRAVQAAEGAKKEHNARSEEVARIKKEGGEIKELQEEMRTRAAKIKDLDRRVKELEDALNQRLLALPNLPHQSVPPGAAEEDNLEVRRWGQPRAFSFTPKAHWDLGQDLGIIDQERAVKVSGARFAFYRGNGALLERGLINFMLDLHTRGHGYQEVFPPFLVQRQSMVGTGQLPKFEEEAFHVTPGDYFLIPTAEVPVTNLYRDEILPEEALPIYHVAYSACFRAEAGAAGRDTRGLIRQHQFNKVELVKFVAPETSYDELEALTADAEEVLQALELPYRLVCLCGGDLGFSAAKTYDLEVWLPGQQKYREISSCSNFEDFQARRANIRYRLAGGGRPRFVHTLNGSGLAVGRTLAAVLENHQQEDGSISIPRALQPYLHGLMVLSNN